MDGTTVVLGWDALDYELVEEFGLADQFGPNYTQLETFDNPHLEEPHTYEVWPSIITGLAPADHGIEVESENGVDWKNPAAMAVSQVVHRFAPERIQAEFDRRMQNQGVKLDFKSADYYEEHDISTVFDGRTARPIAVPNFRVPADDELDIAFDRGAQLRQFLSEERDGNGKTKSVPTASLSRLEERLAAEASGKLGVVQSAIQREYNLIFVWLGFLDTIGHVAPVAAEVEPSWQERAYRMAAEWTMEVKNNLQEEDRLVCVSDHGLQDGDHTHSAFLGTTEEGILDGADSIFDVRIILESITPSTTTTGEPSIRDAYRGSGETESRTADDVRNQLSDLGYL